MEGDHIWSLLFIDHSGCALGPTWMVFTVSEGGVFLSVSASELLLMVKAVTSVESRSNFPDGPRDQPSFYKGPSPKFGS